MILHADVTSVGDSPKGTFPFDRTAAEQARPGSRWKGCVICRVFARLILVLLFLPWLAIYFLPLTAAHSASAGPFLTAIDVGHSKANPGAISATGIGEHQFNESLAKLLLSRMPRGNRQKLKIINETGEDMPLKDRAEAAGKMGADLLLSIHHDSVLPEFLTPWIHNGKTLYYCDRFEGFAVFYSEKNNRRGRSLRYARLLGAALVAQGLTPSSHHAEMLKGEGKAVVDAPVGVFRYDGLAVLKNAKMPSVLLECGIIVNREEEKRLLSDACRERIVSAILKSIDGYSRRGRRRSGCTSEFHRRALGHSSSCRTFGQERPYARGSEKRAAGDVDASLCSR